MHIYIYIFHVLFTAFSSNLRYNRASSQRPTLLRIRAMPSQVYDVIIVGGGAIGLGAAYEVAKAGKSTLVLEQSCLFNAAGSSNDLARMYRTM
jgi:heterodisulfide reductase subunit A-like polyferredoxin